MMRFMLHNNPNETSLTVKMVHCGLIAALRRTGTIMIDKLADMMKSTYFTREICLTLSC